MLFGDDVIHLKGQFSETLWEVAILAAVSGAVSNGLSKPRIHSEESNGLGRLKDAPCLALQGDESRFNREVFVQFAFLKRGELTRTSLSRKLIRALAVEVGEFPPKDGTGLVRRQHRIVSINHAIPYACC
jgi:hypothetical protein